jgi:dihydrofolate reductase
MTKRKIIVSCATSADGFIARRDGSVDWLDRPRPKGDYGMDEFFKSIDTIHYDEKPTTLPLATAKRRLWSIWIRGLHVFTHNPPKSKIKNENIEFVNEPIKPFASKLA